MPPLARPPEIRLSVPRVLRMMVEASATPGFVVSFFRHARVDALAVVRKPFPEVQESGCCIKEDVAPTLLLISGNGT